jgi:exonuclease III
MALKIGTWNVRTMCPGMNNTDLTKMKEVRKTATIDRELAELKVDIAALQETRLPDNGSVKEKNYTFYWQGLGINKPRLYGVGFAVKNKLVNLIQTPIAISERIISIRLYAKGGIINIISAYAPTLAALAEDKDMFYESLQRVIDTIPVDEHIYLLGDLNAHIGADHLHWPICLGHHGIGNVNENGQRLLEFCSQNNLCITNTFFAAKPRHKVSWCHPRSGHWHQIDFIITRRSHFNSVKKTRTFHSADCNTDHALVISKVKAAPRRNHKQREPPKPKINITELKSDVAKEDFKNKFSILMERTQGKGKNSINKTWNTLKTNIYDCAISSFGTKKFSNKDWVEENAETLIPYIGLKKKALINYKRNPSTSTKDHLRHTIAAVQRETRRCANNYWSNLCSAIQHAAEMGNTKSMYENIKVGPQITKIAPLK